LTPALIESFAWQDAPLAAVDARARPLGGWAGSKLPLLVPLAFLVAHLGCHQPVSEQRIEPLLKLTSSTFPEGRIPERCSCHGQDISPALAWTQPPRSAESFVLTLTDRDSSPRDFVHWVLYDLPSATHELREGVPPSERLADDSRQGQNDFDTIGYRGPCPPGDAPHRYVFTIYALDSKIDLPPGATKDQIVRAMSGHIVARGELEGRYPR
jgi:Raf kinase inhibitor-like YbhB/YbcL family protein